jgi:hypothetical protein
MAAAAFIGNNPENGDYNQVLQIALKQLPSCASEATDLG